MFQNIVDEVQEKESSEQNTIKLKENLKEIFKYQNIIVYILAFLLSTISIKNDFAPFGLAILAACLSSTIPVIGVFIVSILGAIVGQGTSIALNYFVTAVLYFFLVLVFKPKSAIDERNEVLKTGGRLYMAYLLVSIIKDYNTTSLIYNIFISGIYAGITYVFYKIFVNGLIAIKDFNIKNAFTIEEVVGASIIITISATALSNFKFYDFNISYIIATFMVMLIAQKNGSLAGMATGISLGLILAIVGSGNMMLLGIFALAGFLAGFLNRFGKLGSILGFVLGTVIVTYLCKGQYFEILNYQNLIVSAILILFVPRNIKIPIEDLIGRNKLLTNIGENRLNENREMAEKLNTLSNTILENIEKEEPKLQNIEEEFVQTFLDNMEEYENNILYDDLSKNEDIIKEIYKQIQEKEIIIEKDLISILEEHNSYIFMQDDLVKHDLQEIIKIVNRTYKMIQLELTKQTEKIKQQKVMKQSLKNVSKAIDDCAKEMLENNNNKFSDLEKEIQKIFETKNLLIKDVLIKQPKNGKYIVLLNLDIKMADSLREKGRINNISDILSKILKSKIAFQKDYKSTEKQEYIQTYSSEDKYIMQVGSSKISEDNSKMSGDCNLQIRINDGKYVLAISDGMGTGQSAREKSKMAINTLKELLEKGFEKQESVALINSMLNQKDANDSYTSMDITVLDLFTGKAEFMKNGSCSTYIKNKKNIQVIKSNQNPIGILENVELKTTELDVSDGDIILMCSDGVLESKENYNKDWIEEYLRNISTNNVQKMADMILAEAIDNSYGIANDDMTVIVAKIMKKK